MNLRKHKLTVFVSLALAAGAAYLARHAAADSTAAIEDKARIDVNGFPLPAGATGRIGMISFRHDHKITAVATSPDGKTVATGSIDRIVRLWDAASGKLVRDFHGHMNPVYVVAFSPDGKLLASGESSEWHGAYGNIPPPAQGAKDREKTDEQSVAFVDEVLPGEPDPKAVAQQGTVKVWDLSAGKELHSFVGHASYNPVAVFSPDSKLLMMRGHEDRTINLMDVATGKRATRIVELPHSLVAAGFAANGRAVITAGNWNADENGMAGNAVPTWDAASGRLRRSFKVTAAAPSPSDESGGLYGAAISPDGRHLALVTADAAIEVVEMATGKVRQKFKARGQKSGNAIDVAFAPDGKLLAQLGNDHKIRLWDFATGKLELTLQVGTPIVRPSPNGAMAPFPGAGLPPSIEASVVVENQLPFAFGPEGKSLTVGSDNRTVRSWDLTRNQERIHATGHRTPVTAVAYAPNGKLLATGGGDKTIRLWDPVTHKEVKLLRGHTGAIVGLAFSPDGKLIASNAAEEECVRVWDVDSGKELHQLPAMQVAEIARSLQKQFGKPMGVNPLNPTNFAPNQGVMSSNTLEPSCCFAFVPGSSLIAVREFRDDPKGFAGLVTLWDASTGKRGRHISVFEAPMIVSDDKPVVPSDDPKDKPAAKLPDISTASAIYTALFYGTAGIDFALAVSADGKLLATSTGASVSLWNVATGKVIRNIKSEGNPISCLAFSPDGKTLADLPPSYAQGLGAHPVGFCPFLPAPGSAKGDQSNDSDNGTIILYDVQNGDELHQLEGHDGRVKAFAFSNDSKRLVSAGYDRKLRLWDIESGRQLRDVPGHFSEVLTVAFAPDGQTIASGSIDTTVLLWNVKDLTDKPGAAGLSPKKIDSLWQNLGDADAAKAGKAMLVLAASREAVPAIRERLKPVAIDPAQDKKIAKLIGELESEQPAVRNRAAEDLMKLVEAAEPALEKVLAGMPSLDMTRRVEQVLKGIEERSRSMEQIRPLRALEVLEQIGTPDARLVLEGIANGAPDARLTLEAKAALDRLGRRAAVK